MPKEKLRIGALLFDTKKAAEDYTRNLIKEIGFCPSVKRKANSYYERLLDIANLHPDSAVKLTNICDFSIVRNKLNQAYELNIVRLDGTAIDISWRLCISGKRPSDMTNLYSAFRYVIDDQTYEFRRLAQKTTCELCKTNLNGCCHIDHVVHFQELVTKFLKTTSLQVPTQFAECDDGTHRHTFLKADDAIARDFSDYHRKHAVLRVLCPTCNLSRTKYKPQI